MNPTLKPDAINSPFIVFRINAASGSFTTSPLLNKIIFEMIFLCTSSIVVFRCLVGIKLVLHKSPSHNSPECENEEQKSNTDPSTPANIPQPNYSERERERESKLFHCSSFSHVMTSLVTCSTIEALSFEWKRRKLRKRRNGLFSVFLLVKHPTNAPPREERWM